MKTLASVVKHALVVGAALAVAAGTAAAQERRVVPAREFILRVDTKAEKPAFRALWVSRDAGRIWKTAKDAGVGEEWGDWVEGVLRCKVAVPEDGIYDFYAQLGDSVSNRTPEPRPGQAADPRFRVEVRMPVKAPRLAWEDPAVPLEWRGGQEVVLKWHALEPDFKEGSAELQYQIDGAPWLPVAGGLEATASFAWIVPNVETINLRLRVRALARSGAEAAAVTHPLVVRTLPRPEIQRARALYDRARVLHAQGRMTEARLKYEDALAAWPQFGEVHNDLGKLHAEIKEPAKALDHFRRARAACSADPNPYVNMARVELELGLRDDAMKNLRDAQALGLDRDERVAVLAGETLWAMARLASLAQERGQAREACVMILRARLASRPTQEKARQMLAIMDAEERTKE
jgi:tetratricopeptide (TPR) repeat protein